VDGHFLSCANICGCGVVHRLPLRASRLNRIATVPTTAKDDRRKGERGQQLSAFHIWLDLNKGGVRRLLAETAKARALPYLHSRDVKRAL
jgi:hypothetical protein